MAVKIVLLCVNIPVFPGGDSDLQSTVHSPTAWSRLPRNIYEDGAGPLALESSPEDPTNCFCMEGHPSGPGICPPPTCAGQVCHTAISSPQLSCCPHCSTGPASRQPRAWLGRDGCRAARTGQAVTACTSHNDNTWAVKQGLGCPDQDGANAVAPTAVGAMGRTACSTGEHGWASPQHGDPWDGWDHPNLPSRSVLALLPG